MKFNHYKIQILIRLVIIGISMFGTLYFVIVEFNYIRIFFLGLGVILLMAELFRYIAKVNHDLANFLWAILHGDFTTYFPESKRGSAYKKLYATFNQVSDLMKKLNNEKEAQYHYINSVVNQISFAVFTYDSTQKITLQNNAFRKLIQNKSISNLIDLNAIHPKLLTTLSDIRSGQPEMVQLKVDNRIDHFSVRSMTHKSFGELYKIVTIQNIQQEMDQNEIVAWKKLMSVLTHEIMNSTAPIVSLSSSLRNLTSKNEILAKDHVTISEGLKAIENRSEGLMNFTRDYRKLMKVPEPRPEKIEVNDFIEEIQMLFSPFLLDTDIQLEVVLPKEKCFIEVDPALTQQAILNLLHNASEAILENEIQSGIIKINVYSDRELHTTIEITDNGGGITEETAKKNVYSFFHF